MKAGFLYTFPNDFGVCLFFEWIPNVQLDCRICVETMADDDDDGAMSAWN